MSENQHATQAVSRLRNGTHNEVARAAVEATLALAYEQRTANLIAWHGVIDSEDQVIEDLYAEIYTRLELGRGR